MDAVSWATIHPAEAGLMAQTIGVLGIDIAKQVFHVVGMDDSGHVVLRKRIARGSDIHVMLTLRCSSRQVVVADEELDGALSNERAHFPAAAFCGILAP
jgi:hypothetical protein